MICHEMNHLQNGVTFTIGPFETLGMETASIVSKIYLKKNFSNISNNAPLFSVNPTHILVSNVFEELQWMNYV